MLVKLIRGFNFDENLALVKLSGLTKIFGEICDQKHG
jgi:hypothetical protein